MEIIVFVNSRDASLQVLGQALVRLLDRRYYVFTRELSEYPQCTVQNTMSKIREVVQHLDTKEDRVIISFGCRVFPDSIKEIEKIASTKLGNIVLLKRLRGSKTWRDIDGVLSFDNERIADCGIFVLSKKDIMSSTQDNFNSYIRTLLVNKNLKAAYISFWIFSNRSL